MSELETPDFIKKIGLEKEEYFKWLKRKAISHHRRDKRYFKKHERKFGIDPFKYTPSNYKKAINDAVIKSNGKDLYTGEYLDWELINKWNNEQATKEHGYKKKFHSMPTVDHIDRDNLLKNLEFAVCSWAVNDAKNDLSHKEFIELCKKVVKHAENRKRVI